MAKPKCEIGYEVYRLYPGHAPGVQTMRSVVFFSKKIAREFKAKNEGSKLRAVQLCNGIVKRVGKKSY